MQPRAVPPASSAPLRTVDRCLQLLGLFTPQAPEWTPSTAATALGIPRSVAHRLLATLAGRGFLAQDGERGRYRPGLRLIALGLLAQRVHGFDVVRPLLRQLAQTTGESVFMTTIDGDTAVTVEKVETEGDPIRLTLEVGSRSPLHAGASQRVSWQTCPSRASRLTSRSPWSHAPRRRSRSRRRCAARWRRSAAAAATSRTGS